MGGGKERLKVVTVEQMRAIEQAADAGGLSYATMMENAGRAVATWLQQQAVLGRAAPGSGRARQQRRRWLGGRTSPAPGRGHGQRL